MIIHGQTQADRQADGPGPIPSYLILRRQAYPGLTTLKAADPHHKPTLPGHVPRALTVTLVTVGA